MDTSWLPTLAGASGPKHRAIGHSLRRAILSGTLPAGERLPPVRDLAWRLDVTPGTVARAYKDLVDVGLLVARVGRGTFVAGGDAVADAPISPTFSPPPGQGAVELAGAHVASVGQDAILSRLLRELPAPQEGSYISYPVDEGQAELRAALGTWLSGADHGAIRGEDLTLSSGGQHALIIVLSALLHGPRPVVLSEELCYPGIRAAASLLRAEMRGLPFDDEGPLAEALDAAAAETGAQVLITSAVGSNPTTIATSLARREALVRVARARGLQIVEDDCFSAGTGIGVPGYRQLAPERSWLVSSLSKTVSPALRLGAIAAPEGEAARLRAVARQHCFGIARPVLDLVLAALTSGEAARIREAGAALIARRAEVLRRAFAGQALAVRSDLPFAWLTLPEVWSPSSFCRAALERGVVLKAADVFALPGAAIPNAVRIVLTGGRDEADFAGAVDRLAALTAAPPQEIEI